MWTASGPRNVTTPRQRPNSGPGVRGMMLLCRLRRDVAPLSLRATRLRSRRERRTAFEYRRSARRGGGSEAITDCREIDRNDTSSLLLPISVSTTRAHPADPRDTYTSQRRASYFFSRYPVLNIHHTMARQTARNTSDIARLISTFTSEMPKKAQR